MTILHSVGFSCQLTAGELQWRSPDTEKAPAASPTQGAWTLRGQGGHVRVAAASEPVNRPSVNQLRPAAHSEPDPFEGPRFAELPRPDSDNSLRALRSVVVERRSGKPSPARSAPPTVRSKEQPATPRRHDTPTSAAVVTRPEEPLSGNPMRTAGNLVRPAERPQRAAGGPRVAQQIIDPFEDVMPKEESEIQAGETSEPTDASDTQKPIEPRPFDDVQEPEPTTSAAETAKDTLDGESTDSAAPPPSEPSGIHEFPDFETKYLEDYNFTEDATRSEEACQKQLSRLKSHTLRPWRDTQKEGWEQRGDEIRDLLNIRAEGTPGADFPFECSTGDDPFEPRQWMPTTYLWKSSALCHKPLYFENVELERYGHSWGPYAQPLVSAAHFFVTIPILPYKMGLKTPNECVYTLGHYRPGNCAPYLINPIPVTYRAILFEAGTVVGVSAIVP